MIDCTPQETGDWFGLMWRTVAVLWKEWPMDMEVVSHIESRGTHAHFSLRGTCPHCRALAVFVAVDRQHFSVRLKEDPAWANWHYMMCCQGCNKLILGIVRVKEPIGLEQPVEPNAIQPWEYRWEYKYEAHYPVGTPDDSVAVEVPAHIAADFSEALRCRWVDGYNATVEMCRRAIEASCIELGAKAKLSITQKIDWVHKQGRINKTLKSVAHKIRLGGNRGSHPLVDPTADTPISRDEADAVIDFTRHYLDHVYVVEKRMAKYDFSKPGRKAVQPPTTTGTA